MVQLPQTKHSCCIVKLPPEPLLYMLQRVNAQPVDFTWLQPALVGFFLCGWGGVGGDKTGIVGNEVRDPVLEYGLNSWETGIDVGEWDMLVSEPALNDG